MFVIVFSIPEFVQLEVCRFIQRDSLNVMYKCGYPSLVLADNLLR